MVSTVQNTDVKPKDGERALVVAVASRAVFHSGPEDGVHKAGVAFPLLKALQTVNERLLQQNPAELLLFDVLLITTDGQQQQQSSSLSSSTRQHGLEVSRFCFSCEEDFVESLLKNRVQLFLSTDREETLRASQEGVPSALLDESSASGPWDQLRVVLCGDAAPTPSAPAQDLASRLGALRRRFGLLHSPVWISLLERGGGRRACGARLRALRAAGVGVDEAFCLGGAPHRPLLDVHRPHLLLHLGLSGPDPEQLEETRTRNQSPKPSS